MMKGEFYRNLWRFSGNKLLFHFDTIQNKKFVESLFAAFDVPFFSISSNVDSFTFRFCLSKWKFFFFFTCVANYDNP